MKQIPGILLSAPKSGSGKTMVTCGILKALQSKGLSVAAFKCGPDYIDPMFHAQVLGENSYNLDSFLCGEEKMRACYIHHAAGADFAVVEGVMGLYDGVGGTTLKASSYETAMLLGLPVVLVVDAREDMAPVEEIRSVLKAQEKKCVSGVILNRVGADGYVKMRQSIESEFSIPVFGYVPEQKIPMPESRYLGLKLPSENGDFSAWARQMGAQIEDTVDLNGLVDLGETLALPVKDVKVEEVNRYAGSGLRIALARDEAFCFFYEDNLRLLREMGAEIVPFSPLADPHLPDDIDGLLLYGGYPELHAQTLSENISMRREIKEALKGGLPCMAECGGFMYLQEEIKTREGKNFAMCGAMPGVSADAGHLTRFGYLTLRGGSVFSRQVDEIRAHEYHHWDSSVCGEDFLAVKPVTGKRWRCMISTPSIFAGYPHINYIGNEGAAEAYLTACRRRKERHGAG